jgi:hypothetical protein
MLFLQKEVMKLQGRLHRAVQAVKVKERANDFAQDKAHQLECVDSIVEHCSVLAELFDGMKPSLLRKPP